MSSVEIISGKKYRIEITRLEFTVTPFNEWKFSELRKEIQQRLGKLFPDHQFEEIFIEAGCSDDAIGDCGLCPPIDLPADATSHLKVGQAKP